VVARDRYEAYRKTPNIVDSYCFEDWAQYHVHCMNGQFSASVYPSSPQGVLERIRCDRITVVDDLTEYSKAARDSTSSGSPATSVIIGSLSPGELSIYSARKVDWPLLKKIGHGLGLIDLRATDTRVDQCRVTDQGDRYAIRQHLFPWPHTLMHT